MPVFAGRYDVRDKPIKEIELRSGRGVVYGGSKAKGGRRHTCMCVRAHELCTGSLTAAGYKRSEQASIFGRPGKRARLFPSVTVDLGLLPV